MGSEPPRKRFKIFSQEEEFKWDLPNEMLGYFKGNCDKSIPEKDIKDQVMITNPRLENLTSKKVGHVPQ